MSRAQTVPELAAHFHGATAELALELADLDDSGEWYGDGFRTCAHWLSIHAGFANYTAQALIDVGRAIRDLPQIRAAFAGGRLSLDKVKALVEVARPADEHVWLDIALAASSMQLGRICQSFHRSTEVDDPERNAAQHAERTFNAWWRNDGMLQLVATLPPEEGRIVLNAVEDAVTPRAEQTAAAAAYSARDVFGSLRADALTSVAEHWLARHRGAVGGKAPRQLVVHVDADTLVGSAVDGRCHLDGGPATAAALARRVGCDSEVLVMLERGASTLNLQRTRRPVSGRLRRAVQLRDGFCRYPGCSVPANDADAHHIRPWTYGGLTELSNLVSLCAFHHQRLHEDAFGIAVNSEGGIEFRTAAGEAIERPAIPLLADGFDGARWLRQLSVLAGRAIDADTAAAQDRGAAFDLGYATEVVDHNVAMASARASPG